MLCDLVAKSVQFLTDEAGVTAIDFGLLVGLIVVAMMIGVNLLGTSLSNLWFHVANNVNPALSNG